MNIVLEFMQRIRNVDDDDDKTRKFINIVDFTAVPTPV